MVVPQVADLIECNDVTVRGAIRRFTDGGFDALEDAPRPGRPASITREDRQALAELLDESAERGRTWTATALPGRAVSFSGVTLWLDKQGKDWGALGIDNEAVIDERANAQVPQLSMTLIQKAHSILCGAGRDDLRLHYGNGDVEHVTPQVRAEVHAAITTSLEWDWPVYIQDLGDRGAIQTHQTDAAKSSTDPSRRSYRDSRK